MNLTEVPPAAPLLLVGAPRSGASCVARLLHRAGVLFGNDRNPRGESRAFLERNRWLFRCAHAEWDTPEPLAWTLEDPELCAALSAELRESCAGKAARAFLGWKAHLRARSLLAFGERWGWSDPRTTFTLPLWLAVFPKARVVHVLRNGVDVALELAREERARRLEVASRPRSARCTDPERAFDVWAAYAAAGLASTEALPPERVLHLRWESFAEAPGEELEPVLAFAGLDPDEEARAAIAEELAALELPAPFAFRGDPEGRALCRSRARHPLLARVGYGDLAKQAS